jgi:hypothetical protein
MDAMSFIESRPRACVSNDDNLRDGVGLATRAHFQSRRAHRLLREEKLDEMTEILPAETRRRLLRGSVMGNVVTWRDIVLYRAITIYSAILHALRASSCPPQPVSYLRRQNVTASGGKRRNESHSCHVAAKHASRECRKANSLALDRSPKGLNELIDHSPDDATPEGDHPGSKRAAATAIHDRAEEVQPSIGR